MSVTGNPLWCDWLTGKQDLPFAFVVSWSDQCSSQWELQFPYIAVHCSEFVYQDLLANGIWTPSPDPNQPIKSFCILDRCTWERNHAAHPVRLCETRGEHSGFACEIPTCICTWTFFREQAGSSSAFCSFHCLTTQGPAKDKLWYLAAQFAGVGGVVVREALGISIKNGKIPARFSKLQCAFILYWVWLELVMWIDILGPDTLLFWAAVYLVQLPSW